MKKNYKYVIKCPIHIQTHAVYLRGKLEYYCKFIVIYLLKLSAFITTNPFPNKQRATIALFSMQLPVPNNGNQ
jgi:hypothetical protein